MGSRRIWVLTLQWNQEHRTDATMEHPTLTLVSDKFARTKGDSA